MRDLFYLSKTQFNRIKPYFPLSHVVPRVDDLRVISGINYVIKNGPCNGRMPPRNTGRTRRCITVSRAGARWEYSTASLRNWLAKREKPERLMIDAPHLKAHRTQPCWYEVEPVCDLLGDWILMCNGSQWKMVVLAFNAVFASE